MNFIDFSCMILAQNVSIPSNHILILITILMLIVIYIYIYKPACKYEVKPHSPLWFLDVFAATMFHRIHFFVCTDKNKYSISKGKIRQAGNGNSSQKYHVNAGVL